MITPAMRALVDRQRLGCVAIVNADGTPNLSPKGTVIAWDDEHLPWVDIRSPRPTTTCASARRPRSTSSIR